LRCGLHRRTDAPELHPGLARRHRIGGLDEIWTAPEPSKLQEQAA